MRAPSPGQWARARGREGRIIGTRAVIRLAQMPAKGPSGGQMRMQCIVKEGAADERGRWEDGKEGWRGKETLQRRGPRWGRVASAGSSPYRRLAGSSLLEEKEREGMSVGAHDVVPSDNGDGAEHRDRRSMNGMSPWSLRPLLEMDEITCPYLYDVVGQYLLRPFVAPEQRPPTSTNIAAHRGDPWTHGWMDGWMADGWGQMPPNFGAIVPASASKPAGPQTIGLGGALRSSRPATGANLALETPQFGWCRWDAAQRLHALAKPEPGARQMLLPSNPPTKPPPPADLPLIAPPHLVSSLDHPGLACDWIESVATSFPVHALVSSRHRYETLLAALCSSPASVTSRRLLSQPAVCTPAPAASHLLRQAVESLSLSSSRLSRSLPSTVPPRRPPPGGLARFARFDRVTDSSRTRHAFAALHKSLSRQSWPGRMSQPRSRPCRKP
ncbi:hypothetical protein PCL_05976 [Purpureocillium lilacinum]|uniref:Uncharacterized protein n=1 Tax=Purpureocillium lilacinum TaxID=33203 RepID=A0A2U3ELC7_PURLI|nr:hypothetical protein PCL_05976 [Purpureocillium lilacinum]